MAPTHNYWTRDKLQYGGSGINNFSAFESGGSECNNNTPMRICAGAADLEGNNCNWYNCGWNGDTSTNQYFGGCNRNETAGTLCCL